MAATAGYWAVYLRCELTNVSMTSATCLPPDVVGLYLSASSDPSHVPALSANVSMRMSVAAFAAAGGAIFAEDMGLAYLASSVRIGPDAFGMADVLPIRVIVHEDKQISSYTRLRVHQPPAQQQPMLQPSEWMRGIADTTLEIREEVPSNCLGSAKRIAELKVSRLFEAVLVDIPGPNGCASATAIPGSNAALAQSSLMHGMDPVQEGYLKGQVAATLVHVCFASQPFVVQPFVEACAKLNARDLASAASQHAASARLNVRRSNIHASLVQSGSEGCLTSYAHPLVRLSGDSVLAPSSPSCMTSASAISMDVCCSPFAQKSGSNPGSLTGPVSQRACGKGDSRASLSKGSHDSSAAPRPGWASSGMMGWQSMSDNLSQAADPCAAQEVAAPCRHTQLWMPPQPLPRARVHSGRDLTAHDTCMQSQDKMSGRHTKSYTDCMACSSTLSEEALPSRDVLSVPKGSSTPSLLSLGAQGRAGGTALRRQVAALSPSITSIISSLGLGALVGGAPAEPLTGTSRQRGRSQSHRTVISLVPELTGTASPRSSGSCRHRRTPSTDSKSSTVSWRAVAQRLVMDTGDWQSTHILHPDQITALTSPMVLTWESERTFSKKRGGVLPVLEAAHATVIDALRRMEAPVDVVTLPAPRSVCDMYSTIRCLGSILGAATAAESLINETRTAMHSLARQCFKDQPVGPRRKVMVLRCVAPYLLAGGWIPELVTLCGAVCPCMMPGEGALQVEWSDVVSQDPDAIVVLSEIVGAEAAVSELQALGEEAGWWNLTATRNREVFVVDANYLLRVGPGVVSAAETVARICRPDLREQLGEGAGKEYVLKLDMTAAQRCRPTLLPSFFRPVTW